MKDLLEISKRQAVLLLRILYPVWLAIGLFTFEYIPSLINMSGNAIATANNIIANELLFRISIAGSLVTQLIHILVVLVLYKLFKSVNRNQSLLIVVFGLISVPIAMLNTLNKVAALLSVNNPEQMMIFLELNKLGMVIAGIFWGLWLLPQGVLICKSGYFPKMFARLMVLAGVAYFLMSFIQLLFPDATRTIFVLGTITMGEVIFMAWVTFVGVRKGKL